MGGQMAISANSLGQIDGAHDLLGRWTGRAGSNNSRNGRKRAVRLPFLKECSCVGIDAIGILSIAVVEVKDVSCVGTVKLLPQIHRPMVA